jgi:hypothetical protein
MSDETRRQDANPAKESEHERIQREAANQQGKTPGGLDPWDVTKIADQQRVVGDSLDPDVLDEDMRDRAEIREADQQNREQMAAADQRHADEERARQQSEQRRRYEHDETFASHLRAAARRTPQERALLIRVAGLGMALAGVFLLLQGLQQHDLMKDPLPTLAPATAAAKATATPALSPIAQASPQVNGTGTATASFSKVSGPCRLAAQFTDRYAFAATGGALTLTQLSDNHVTTGRIEPSGDFTTTAPGQSYKGRVNGVTATGQHFYTAEGCNEVYAFTMTFPTPLIAAPIVVPATIAAAVLTPTPRPPASTEAPASAPAAPAGGPNVALAALGLILTVGGVGVATGGPALLRRKGEGDRDA